MAGADMSTAAAGAVRWRLDDRILQFFSPRLARRRYAERIATAVLRRGYDGAIRGSGTDGWVALGTSADAEIGAASAMLRNRSRDLVRNNPIAAQAVQVLINNIVGTGIQPRAATKDKALNDKVNALWKRWSARCDAHGHTDFHGLVALAVREMIEGGDVFCLQRPQRRGSPGLAVPLKIELREADHLDAGKFLSEGPASPRIVQGIETDADGNRIGYWMFPDHPGDQWPVFSRRLESVRIPAARVAHMFERQRVQMRGVPWGTPALRDLRDIDDYKRAELVRKKTEACFVGVVIDDEDGTVAGQSKPGLNGNLVDSGGNVIEEWAPGMMAYSRGGRDVKFNQPHAVGGVYEWNKTQLHYVAAGFRVPYALMTGDLSQANFSSSRVGLNEFRRMIEALQWQTVIPMCCQPIWDWFIAFAQISGQLPDGEIAVEWAPPRFEAVNPLQDATADLLEVRAGFSTRSQQIARRGYDPGEITEEWAKDAEAADAAGLVFDSDPRRVTKVGVAQSSSADQVADPPTNDTEPPQGATP